MNPSSPHSTSSNDRPAGEALVWLCSAGLALGVLMVVILLGLITREGLAVFWPKDVVEITLQAATDNPLSNSPVLSGSIARKQVSLKKGVEEWQLFVGNKDVYGSMFTFIDAAQVADLRYPREVVVAERMEYGNAIFYPLSLTTIEGETVPVEDPRFWSELDRVIREARARFKEINHLEKHEIGSINRRVNSLTLELRHLDRRLAEGQPARPAAREQILAELASLETAFQALAAQARDLRALQQAGRLDYRLASGEVRSQAFGDILKLYQPNDLGFFGKLLFAIEHFWAFLSERPREANTEGGIFPAIFGTFVMTVLMSMAVMPFGVIAAIYLREYARQGVFVQVVRIAVNNLAGVPSIVYGVFGLGFFVYFVGGTMDQLFFSDRLPTATFGTGGILWASLTLALMTVPVVIVATEEALAAVPRGAREASLACGASKWQTIQRIVLPASAPGILTGLILAMARGAGEVAPLMLVGVVKLAPSLPIDGVFPFVHFERKFMHLGFHIYDLGFQSPDSEAARPMVFATTFLLILLVILLNLGAVLLRNHLRNKYKTHTF